jgi:hypothetical protein
LASVVGGDEQHLAGVQKGRVCYVHGTPVRMPRVVVEDMPLPVGCGPEVLMKRMNVCRGQTLNLEKLMEIVETVRTHRIPVLEDRSCKVLVEDRSWDTVAALAVRGLHEIAGPAGRIEEIDYPAVDAGRNPEASDGLRLHFHGHQLL